MNQSTSRSLTEALLKLQELYPHWRYGQLVANVAAWAGEDGPAEVGDVDDEQLLRAAQRHLELKASARSGERRVG